MEKNHYHSKLSVINNKTTSIEKRFFNPDFNFGYEYQKLGFPYEQHNPIYWTIKLKNKGDLPSTNISLNYTLVIKKSTFKYTHNGADVDYIRIVDHEEYNKQITIPYMGADEEVNIDIGKITGQFPVAILFLNELKSDQNEFITETVRIGHYIYPNFRFDIDNYRENQLVNTFQDGHQIRNLVGFYYDNENS